VDTKDIGANPAASIQVGDAVFLVPASLLEEHVQYGKTHSLSTSDRILQGKAEYRVILIPEFGNGTMLRIVARKAN
jgi:hypothetical protein